MLEKYQHHCGCLYGSPSLTQKGRPCLEVILRPADRAKRAHPLIPWRREWLPTPVFLPGESHEQRSLVGYSPWGHKELDTTE